jgi:hypothetical protein
VIRNAVIHVINEQPLMADLFGVPSAEDLTLVCTNLRTMNGKRPVFADHIDSVFVFPYAHIRFVEIPAASVATGDASAALAELAALSASTGNGNGAGDSQVAPPAPEPEPEADLEIDEDFLRRIREV